MRLIIFIVQVLCVVSFLALNVLAFRYFGKGSGRGSTLLWANVTIPRGSSLLDGAVHLFLVGAVLVVLPTPLEDFR